MGRTKVPKKDSADLLFRSLAEQVKLPFIQIVHSAELSKISPDQAQIMQQLESISLTSAAALRLIDGYLLSVQLQREPQLPLEPVSLGSVLYDTAQSLDSFARAHNCEIELHIGGKYGPVMARREVVQAALMNLGYSFIEAATPTNGRTRITIAVRKNAHGINTGVFSSNEGLSSSLFKQAKSLKGLVKQPMSNFSTGSGAGVFIADSLFDYLQSPLKTGRFQTLAGLSATLRPSLQLSLV
jgi:hypothetical protein